MKIKNKTAKTAIRFIFINMCLLVSLFSINVFAKICEQNQIINYQSSEISPRTEDVTGYKYKYINGVKYKRLWSYTYEKWIDEDWSVA